MVEYVEAIKRPFSDAGKLVLSIVLAIIPIVQFIFMGYALNVAKSAMAKDFKLPEYRDFGKLFIDGLLVFIINIIYSLPMLVLMGIFFFVGAFSVGNLFTGILSGQGALGLLGIFAGLGVYMVVFAIVGIIFSILGLSAQMRFADVREFGAAFEFGAVGKKAFTGTFIVGWILGMIIGGVIGGLLSLIPFVGIIIGLPVFVIISYTIIGQAYSEA